MKFHNKYKSAMLFCSTFLLMQLTGCGGGSGFADGPRATEGDTGTSVQLTSNNTSELDNTANDDPTPDNPAPNPTSEITFSPEPGTRLQADDNEVIIEGLVGYSSVCIREDGQRPEFEGTICPEAFQLDNPPGDLSMPIACDENISGIQSHTLSIIALDAQAQITDITASFTQDCTQAPPPSNPPGDPEPEPDPKPEPNRGLAVIAIPKDSYTTRENITVSYSVSAFNGQPSPSGERLALFKTGNMSPDCQNTNAQLWAQEITEAQGVISLPRHSTLGAHQLQVLDRDGCHLARPLNVTVIEPDILIRNLVNDDITGYNGTQETTLISDGPNTNKDMGKDKELSIDGLDPLVVTDPVTLVQTVIETELIGLIQWDIPEALKGGELRSVALRFDVKGGSDDQFEIYAMNQSWQEREVTFAKANLAENQGTTLLGEFTPRNKGTTLVTLNAAGNELVQAWMDGTEDNHGFVIRAQAGGTDGVDIKSSNEKNVVKKPVMIIQYVE